MFSSEELDRAKQIVYGEMLPTPTLQWPQLSEWLGTEYWLKHENHTPTGAFKVRGGLVYCQKLGTEDFAGELITATRGNHGQSIPFAARAYGFPVTVYVPHGNAEEKNQAMRHWGAKLVEYGRDFDEAREEALAVARQKQMHMVGSFHPNLVVGVATYVDEIFQQMKQTPDVIYVPIGMGSGACAVVLVRDLLGLKTQVVGVVSNHADAFAQSFAQGKIIESKTAHTFADGVAIRVPHPDAFAVLEKGLERVVGVDDEEVAQAVRMIFKTTHNVAEGAGAIATAAAYKERMHIKGKIVAGVLTGGNIDSNWLATILQGELPSL